MSGICPDDADLFTGVNRPHGNGGVYENARDVANPVLENIRRENDIVRENDTQQAWVDTVANAIDMDTLPGKPLTSGDRQQLSSGARQLRDLVDRAVAAEGIRASELDEAMRKISGSTVSDATRWLDITNTVSRMFAWKDAIFNKFALTNFGQDGRSILDNQLVSAFQDVEPRTRGRYEKYLSQAEDIAKKYDALAGRLGYDTRTLLEVAGHYANAQHVPEVNALLLQRWAAEVAAERAKPEASRNASYIAEREKWIQNLDDNLDSIDTLDAEGFPVSIKSAGYTNGQAEKLKNDIVRDTGATHAEMEAIAADIRALYRKVMEDRIDAGFVPAELVESFPAFEYYVPLKTKYDNTTGAVNNTHIYNPSNYHALDGRSDTPDSAWLSVMHFARRASNEYGMQRFGTELAAAKMVSAKEGRDISGLEMRDYAQLMALKNSQDPVTRQWATNIDSRGGIIVDVPIRDVEGNAIGSKRMVLSFDPNWTDPRSANSPAWAQVTGAALNDAINGKTKVAASTSLLTTPTSWYGQMFTRFNPPFAPVNSIRDLFERGVNIASRDYYRDDGTVLRGSSIVGRYFLNAPRAGKLLYDAITGKAEADSPAVRYWREYVDSGLHQRYNRDQNKPQQSLAELVNRTPIDTSSAGWTARNLSKMPGLKQRLENLADGGKAVMSKLDAWNDYFNNVAIFNHFITMRESGMSVRNAAQGTLEMLNLYQGGKLQPALSMLFPFVKPTAASGVALFRTMGLAPNAAGKFQPNLRGTASILGAMAAYTMLMPLMKESLGRDPDTGLYRYDQLSLSDLQRFIPIGLDNDGDYFKMPTGFGPIQLAVTLAVGSDRVSRGIMRPEDFVFETLYTVGKNVAPGDWPDFSAKQQPREWLTYALAPTILKPLMTDIDMRGRPITEARPNDFRPRADQGRLSTERIFHQTAKLVHQTTGIDLAPEQVKNLSRHLNVGPVRMLTALLNETMPNDNNLRTKGTRTTTQEELGPWLSAMGGTLLYGRTYDTGRTMYYQALDNFRSRIRNEGIKVQNDSYGSDTAKREAYQTNVLRKAGWSADDIHDFLLLMNTEKALRSSNQKFNRELRPVWLSSDSSAQVRRAFEAHATDRATLYDNAVRQLRYYQGVRDGN